VYWTRRLLVLVVALALVFGVARLLGGGGPGGDAPSARPVGADQTTAAASTSPTPTATGTPTAGSGSPAASPSGTPTGRTGSATPAPATPSGACENSDIIALPSVASPAYAGGTVIVSVTLTTRTAPACTWDVSADALVIKVTSGDERFWSTQDCIDAVPDQSVVVRKDLPTTIALKWHGMRSDKDCTTSTSWAEPGYYHVIAAAFGAEPTDTQFRLLKPVRETITATPTPDPSGAASPGRSASTASPRR
jgi:hypothetical protein